MRTVLSVLLVALFISNILAGFAPLNPNSFAPKHGAKSCKRSLAAKLDAGNSDVKFASSAACRFGGKAGAATVVAGSINVLGRPDMSIGVFSGVNKNNLTNIMGSLNGFRVVLERVIEYHDNDGVAGYQPTFVEGGTFAAGSDTPCLNGITLLENVAWSPFTITNTTGSDGSVYTLSSNSTSPAYYSLSFMLTTTTVASGKIVLDPSSFKFTFNINNYVYKNAACASGLSFRILLVSANSVRRKAADDSVQTDIDVSSQDSVTITSSTDKSTGSFFLWDRSVTLLNGSSVVLYNNLGVANDLSSIGLKVPPAWQVNSLWFSVPGNVTDFSWDPYAVASDDSVTDSSTTTTTSTPVTSSALRVIETAFSVLMMVVTISVLV